MEKKNKVISLEETRNKKSKPSNVVASKKDTPISRSNLYASEYWKKIIGTHRIYVDTCSLMHDEAGIFFEDLRNSFKEYNRINNTNHKLIVAGKVIAEIQKHLGSTGDVLRKATNAKKIINDYFVDKLIEVREDPGEHIADNVFMTQFTRLRVKDNLCLITQDVKLSIDIYNLNKITSVNTRYSISVVKISKTGDLHEVCTNETNDIVTNSVYFNSKNTNHQPYVNKRPFVSNSNNNNNNNNKKKEVGSQDINIKKFKYIPDVTPMKDSLLNVSVTPKENDTVLLSDNKNIKLGKKIAAGGEGTIYEVDEKRVCKIYFSEKTTKLRYEKILKMLEVPIDNPSICWPIDMVRNTHGEFVGYIMPKAKGSTLKTGIFFPQVFKTKYPNWTKADLVQLCITILEGMEFLHKRNIIIGDINPYNILFESSTKVYFVDTDSFQIEKFSCPVGTIDFSAPEIVDKDRLTFMRNFGHEYFAVASLLFMLMLPGKSPYSKQGGGNTADNIKAMDFAYPYKAASTGKIPEGAWRFIWSNLPSYLKQAFYETFRHGQPYSTNATRKSSSEWLSIMRRYKADLDRKIFDDDEMYKIFAERFKLYKDTIYKNCPSCGILYPENQLSRTGRCRTCNDTTGQTIKCVQCNKTFEFTYGELDYYNQKNLSIPKTCKACRVLKSQTQTSSGGRNTSSSYGYSGYSTQPTNTYSYGSNNSKRTSSYGGNNSRPTNNYGGNNSSKSGGCLTSLLFFIVPAIALFSLFS